MSDFESIRDLRARYPEYDDLSDEKLLTYYRSKFPSSQSHSNLTAQIEKVTEIDVTQNRLANWWNKGQVKSVADLLDQKLRVAGSISVLNKLQQEQYLSRAQTELQEALLVNQIEVARQATFLGIPAAQYGDYTLEILKGKIQAQLKVHEADVQTTAERISIEQTFQASLKKASIVFENQQRLIKELGELETILENVESEALPVTAKRKKKHRLKQLISVKEAELSASQQETLSEGNRRRLGPASEEEADSSGPAE